MTEPRGMGAGLFASRAAVGAAVLWLVAELARGGIPWTPAFFAALSALWLLREAGGGRFWEKYPASAVFFLSLAAYLSTFRWHGGDDIPNSLIPFALLRHGTLSLDPVLDPWLTGKTGDFTVLFFGRRLSVYPIAPGMLALPVYIIPALAKAPVSEAFLHNLSKLSGALIAAVSAAALYRAVSRRCSRDWALTLAGLYALGSWALSVSSQALWQHGPAQLGVSLGLLGLETAGFAGGCLAGFGMGLAAAARPDSVFYLAALAGFFLFMRRGSLAGFAAGAGAPLALLAAYWLHYTGRLRPPEMEFQSRMLAGFQPQAFIGLMFSPTRGFPFFFPAAVFGVWSGLRRARNPAAPWLLAACAGTWVFMSFYSAWVGGNTFGPRYFAVAALVLAYLCADLEKDIRSSPRLLWAWSFAVSASILIHALGGYMTWPGSNGNRYELLALWDWRLHPVCDIFTSSGSLKALPGFVRASAGLAVLGYFCWLAVRLRRALELPAGRA